jgi:hypothetical protein
MTGVELIAAERKLQLDSRDFCVHCRTITSHRTDSGCLMTKIICRQCGRLSEVFFDEDKIDHLQRTKETTRDERERRRKAEGVPCLTELNS